MNKIKPVHTILVLVLLTIAVYFFVRANRTQSMPKKPAPPLPTIAAGKTYKLSGKIAYNSSYDACSSDQTDDASLTDLHIEVLSPKNSEDVTLGKTEPDENGNFEVSFSGSDFVSGVFSVHLRQGDKLVYASDLIGSGVASTTCHASILNSYQSPFAIKNLKVL